MSNEVSKHMKSDQKFFMKGKSSCFEASVGAFGFYERQMAAIGG